MEKYDILFMSLDRKRHNVGSFSSIGQRCLSAYMYKNSGFTSRVLTGASEDAHKIIMRDIDTGGTKIVGFYSVQDNYSIVRHVISDLKDKDVTIIVGGPHSPSILEDDIRTLGIDYVIDGEGEIVIDELMHFLVRKEGSPEKIKGIRYIDANGQYHDNGPGEVLDNLDDVGFFNEEWEILKDRDFRRFFTLTGRGCPNRCAFCYEGITRKVRLRSVENVLEEIDNYRKEHPELVLVNFLDDTFTLNTERLLKFCEGMKQRNLKWCCELHAAKINKEPELIGIMEDAGLVNVQLGVESGSDRVLKAYNKGITSEMIIKVVELISKNKKVTLEGNFILGGALETKETIEESIALAEKMIEIGKGLVYVEGIFYAPYERTLVTTNPENYEMTLDMEMADYMIDSMKICVNSTTGLSRDEIQYYQREFNRRTEAAFRKAAATITRQELELLLSSHIMKSLQGVWRKNLLGVSHVACYLLRGMIYHSLFNPSAVPIRTFNDLVYEDGALVCEYYRFEGNEKRMLELSSGARTFEEISEIMGISLNEVYTIYSNLRDKLMVYMEMY